MASFFRDIFRGGSIFSGSHKVSSCPKRVYGPLDVEDTFLIKGVEDAMNPVLAKIQEIYGMVDIDAYPNGFCFGLLDPLSNIVVNSAISGSVYASGRLLLARRDAGQTTDMTMRSLNGLVAFLNCLFPYLPQKEALQYLDVAGADLIVACLLIIWRRGMFEFDPCSSTAVAAFETALRCAAGAAGYPEPEQLAQKWKLLSHDDRLMLFYQPRSRRSRPEDMILNIVDTLYLAGASNDVIEMEKLWSSAKCRLATISVKELPPARAALKRMLLATIHGFYLKALAMLPTDQLCSRFHRSILKGGYCYGPLDPVSNILFNTLWYDQKFPSNQRLTLQMVSTECLWRVTARSLYGLVSFLCTRYHALTPNLAMQRLLVAKADLRAADPNLPAVGTEHILPSLNWSGCYQVESGTTGTRELQCRAVDSCTPSASAMEAYAAAATAVFHPDPSAHQELLGSPSGMAILQVASDWLHQDCVLSAQDISFISQLFRSPLIKELGEPENPVRRNKGARQHMSSSRRMFWGQHDRVCTMVKAALDTFNKNQEFKYSIHVICGVNEFVSGPIFCTDRKVRPYNPWTPFKFNHSHINFLATGAESKPVLFFAECSNQGTDEAWCIPVEPPRPVAGHVRCIYCERREVTIVHPTVNDFHGRAMEFEKVLRGEPLFDGSVYNFKNDRSIIRRQDRVDYVHWVRDDSIYSVDAPFDGSDDEVDMRRYVTFDCR